MIKNQEHKKKKNAYWHKWWVIICTMPEKVVNKEKKSSDGVIHKRAHIGAYLEHPEYSGKAIPQCYAK